MFKRIVTISITFLIILQLFHLKEYYQHPISSQITIEQNENYQQQKMDALLKKKTIVIIRNYKKLNSLINLTNLQKYNELIKFKNYNYSIIDIINNKIPSFILFQINFARDLPIVSNLGSPLTISKKIFATWGIQNTITSITSLAYERNYFHVIKGEIVIYLIKPALKSKLSLTHSKNKSIKTSDIDIQNPEMLLYPEYSDVQKEYIPITLRQGNLLYLPNDWSFYIYYKKNTLLLNYNFQTITSKIASYF